MEINNILVREYIEYHFETDKVSLKSYKSGAEVTDINGDSIFILPVPYKDESVLVFSSPEEQAKEYRKVNDGWILVRG